jgi:integrase/recombinase XerC
LEAPQGRFALRPGLTSSGEMPLADALVLVEADWDRQLAAGTISDDVIRCYKRDCRSLVKYAAKRFGRELVRDLAVNDLVVWMATPKPDGSQVTNNTRRGRLSAAKAFFKTCTCLGIYDLNPAESIAETERQARYVCRLTDDQMDQLRRCAPFTLAETKTPAALALMMLGAGSREAAYVRVRDIDFTHGRVWVHDGGERFAPRWLPIDDDWARQALASRVTALAEKHTDPVELAAATVAYERSRKRGADTPLNRQSAISRTLSKLMTKARVHRAGENRVESIREWVAFRVFSETKSVEAVAERLGMASLDAAAHIVGYDWVAAHRIDAAPPAEPGATP